MCVPKGGRILKNSNTPANTNPTGAKKKSKKKSKNKK